MNGNGLLRASRAGAWHQRLVGTGIGERTRTFLRGLQWTLSAAVISRLFAGVATVFTARQLGPSEFGRASLVLATTFWIQIPLFLGMPSALMRFIPVAKPSEREAWVSTGLSLLALSGALTLGLGLGLTNFGAGLLGVSRIQFQLGLLWCSGFFFYTTSTFLSAARERFRVRATLEVVFAVLFSAQIFVLWFFKTLDAPLYITAMAVAYGLVGVAGLLTQRPTRFVFNGFTHRARAFLVFGLIASTGAIGGALLQSIGRLIANRYLDISQVGMLAAYQAGSLQIVLYFMGAGLHVFLPVAARTEDRAALFRKLTRVSAFVVVVAGSFSAVGLTAYFFLLGIGYPLGFPELAVFAVASGLAMQHGILSWFFTSGGSRGVVASVIVAIVAGMLNAFLSFLWIPRWGVLGAGAALGAAYCGGILACYLPKVKRYGLY